MQGPAGARARAQVRIKLKHMEIEIRRRETTGAGAAARNESETLAKYEIMDGAPVRGENIPIRSRCLPTFGLPPVCAGRTPGRLPTARTREQITLRLFRPFCCWGAQACLCGASTTCS